MRKQRRRKTMRGGMNIHPTPSGKGTPGKPGTHGNIAPPTPGGSTHPSTAMGTPAPSSAIRPVRILN
jgi:hypothetical protein